AWFTVELRDEMYALRRELDRLKKKVEKLCDNVSELKNKHPNSSVTLEQLKEAVQKVVAEASVKQASSLPRSDASAEKRKREEVKKDTAAVYTFISPRAMLSVEHRTPAKRTPGKLASGPSRAKKAKLRQSEARQKVVRFTVRRRILEGKQISENMLQSLQMGDLKKLCTKHNIKYKGMQQARVALRKIPGVIVTVTEDMVNPEESGEEAQTNYRQGDHGISESMADDAEEGVVSESSEDPEEEDDENEVSHDVEPSAN
ncbi:hypothetical protein CBR_g40179, partial [Chara braunii]